MTDPTTPANNAPLTQVEFDAVSEAILAAYPNRMDIEVRVRRKWGLNLRDQVYLDVPGGQQIHNLLQWADATGRARELVGLLWSARPESALHAVATVLIADLDAVAERYADQPLVAPPPVLVTDGASLEAEVSARSRMIGIGDFEERLGRARRAVCRVEAGPASGTGFLIGRRTVLTNYHVIRAALEAGLGGEAIVCRFDYLSPDDRGRPVAGAAGRSWLGPHSPYSDSDVSGIGDPQPGQLDFALIHLADDVEPDRAPLTLGALAPVVAPQDVAMVIQHPQGEAMRVALGSIVAFPGAGLRYRYNVTTRPGSSGAPVFSAELNLIGLHHAADPGRDPVYNQAVPAWRIARAIEGAGFDLKSL